MNYADLCAVLEEFKELPMVMISPTRERMVVNRIAVKGDGDGKAVYIECGPYYAEQPDPVGWQPDLTGL